MSAIFRHKRTGEEFTAETYSVDGNDVWLQRLRVKGGPHLLGGDAENVCDRLALRYYLKGSQRVDRAPGEWIGRVREGERVILRRIKQWLQTARRPHEGFVVGIGQRHRQCSPVTSSRDAVGVGANVVLLLYQKNTVLFSFAIRATFTAQTASVMIARDIR